MSSDDEVLIGIPSINGSDAVQWVNAPINSDKRSARVTDQQQLTELSLWVNKLHLVNLATSSNNKSRSIAGEHLHHVGRRSSAIMW